MPEEGQDKDDTTTREEIDEQSATGEDTQSDSVDESEDSKEQLDIDETAEESSQEGDTSSESGSEVSGGPDSEVAGESESEIAGEAAPPEKGADEVYCSSCGAAIKKNAEVCPECGVRQPGGSGPTTEKNPGISAIASLIIPGAGQIYNGQFARGAVWFIGAGIVDLIILLMATILTVILIGPLLLLLIPVVNMVAAYDAYQQAEKINAGEITV